MPFSADNIRHQTMQSIFGNTQKILSPTVGTNHCLTAGKRWGHLWESPLFLKGLLSRWETAARPGSTPSGTGLKKQAPTLTAESRNVPVPNARVPGRLRVCFVFVAASHSGKGILLRTEQIIIQGAVSWHGKALSLTVSSSFSHPPPSTMTGLNKLGDEVCCLTVCQQNTRSGD